MTQDLGKGRLLIMALNLQSSMSHFSDPYCHDKPDRHFIYLASDLKWWEFHLFNSYCFIVGMNVFFCSETGRRL